MIEKDNFSIGLLLGAVTPVIAFVIVELIFNGLTQMGLMEEITMSASPRRERTIALLAICANLLPFNWSRKNRYDSTMRGIVFPTLIYVGFWIYRYKDILF